jgi:hypothetical protein
MTAMHKATDNATDLRNDLKLTYNKAVKHLLLTKLEIVGGAEGIERIVIILIIKREPTYTPFFY